MRRRAEPGDDFLSRSPAEWIRLGEGGEAAVPLALVLSVRSWAGSVLSFAGALRADEVERLEGIAAGVEHHVEVTRADALRILRDRDALRDPMGWVLREAA